jgi:lipid-A-disaccharide synthase
MKPRQIMIIAGEASGDLLAAELVTALRRELTAAEVSYTADVQPLHTGLEPRFFGAGGSCMRAAGVELAFDLTQHSVIGLDMLRGYLKFRRLFHQLLQLAQDRKPDVIIGVDYGYFNLKFGHAIRQLTESRRNLFNNWKPKLVQFVSPQVWASRAGRASQIAEDYDLLLSIFPFEKDWYEKRVPRLRVDFVGHPLVERFATSRGRSASTPSHRKTVLLLPGSRKAELTRHIPVMLEALQIVETRERNLRFKMVLPNKSLSELAKSFALPPNLEIQIGDLPLALSEADAAISKTGTVTVECAFFGVPTVTFYKTSWLTYEFGKRIVKVKSLTMPNLLAGEEVFPEFVQHAATPRAIAAALLDLLQNENKRQGIKARLVQVISSLGGPGAATRAAQSVASLLSSESKASCGAR